tara:strand:+ start:544 stop:939 length:396 start_codon:yes stop_codon:yes gene_type:complete
MLVLPSIIGIFLMNKKNQILKEIFDYYSLRKDVSLFDKFWRKSHNHFQIILLLGSTPHDVVGYAYEEICELYPHKDASRTTILSILKEGTEKNFFFKSENTTDHRKHNYMLTDECKKKVIDWLEKHPIRNL